MKSNLFKKAVLAAVTFGSFALMSCSTGVLTGQTTKETRSLPAFEGISLSISADVFLQQGNQQSVEIEADKSSLEVIETEMRGNTLVIKTLNNTWRNLGEVRVYITVPVINHISVSGSGKINCETPVTANELDINVSGSGSVNISKLESPDISTVITGSGDVFLAGDNNAESRLKTTITGSGSFKSEDLKVATAHINITGSGSARVNVIKDLETNITGSGSVFYKGNPIINATATGSGKTRSIN
jgi:hypothetical protein